MDLKPRGVMRCLQTGDLKRVLESNTIWLCSGCQTCVERCPHDVDIPSVMEQARYMAARQGKHRKNTRVFNELFLLNLKLFGKSHEMVLAGLYNVFGLSPFQDLWQVPHMLRNHLIELKPHQVRDIGSLRRMMKNAEKWSEGK